MRTTIRLLLIFLSGISSEFGTSPVLAQVNQSPVARVAALRGDGGFKYDGKVYSLEELLRQKSLVHELRKSYFVQSDPNDTLSPNERLELGTHGVEFTNSCKRGPVVIDAIGVAITPLVYRDKEKPWKELAAKFRQDHLKKTLTDVIVNDLIRLQQSASELWRKNTKRIVDEQIYVKARIGEHYSKIRSKQEFWLIVEIGVTGTKFEEFFQNELYDIFSRSPLEGLPFIRIPQAIMPHPQSEETLFEIREPKKLEPNRGDGPEVRVPNDGLKPIEREQAHGFSLTTPAGVKQMQIEGHGFRGRGANFEADFMELLLKRIPPSSVETPESLHLKVGDACAALRRQFNLDQHIEVTISDAGFAPKGSKYYQIDCDFK